MGRMKSVLMSPACRLRALRPKQEAPTMVRRYARRQCHAGQDADLPVGVWWRDACGGVENLRSRTDPLGDAHAVFVRCDPDDGSGDSDSHAGIVGGGGGFVAIEIIVAGRVPDATVAAQLRDLRAPCNIRHLDIQFATGDSSRKEKRSAAMASAADCVLDDDVIVAPIGRGAAAEPFQDPQVGLLSGPSLVPEDINWVGRLAGDSAGVAGGGMWPNATGPTAMRPTRWTGTGSLAATQPIGVSV